MRVLETVAGFVIGLVSLLVAGVGALAAFGSIGRYIRMKNM
jgi:hypothetical protein